MRLRVNARDCVLWRMESTAGKSRHCHTYMKDRAERRTSDKGLDYRDTLSGVERPS